MCGCNKTKCNCNCNGQEINCHCVSYVGDTLPNTGIYEGDKLCKSLKKIDDAFEKVITNEVVVSNIKFIDYSETIDCPVGNGLPEGVEVPTASFVGDKLIIKYSNCTGYYTYNGVDWILDFSNDPLAGGNNKNIHDTTHFADNYEPYSPTYSGILGDTLVAFFANGICYYTHNGTTWVIDIFVAS